MALDYTTKLTQAYQALHFGYRGTRQDAKRFIAFRQLVILRLALRDIDIRAWKTKDGISVPFIHNFILDLGSLLWPSKLVERGHLQDPRVKGVRTGRNFIYSQEGVYSPKHNGGKAQPYPIHIKAESQIGRALRKYIDILFAGVMSVEVNTPEKVYINCIREIGDPNDIADPHLNMLVGTSTGTHSDFPAGSGSMPESEWWWKNVLDEDEIYGDGSYPFDRFLVIDD